MHPYAFLCWRCSVSMLSLPQAQLADLQQQLRGHPLKAELAAAQQREDALEQRIDSLVKEQGRLKVGAVCRASHACLGGAETAVLNEIRLVCRGQADALALRAHDIYGIIYMASASRAWLQAEAESVRQQLGTVQAELEEARVSLEGGTCPPASARIQVLGWAEGMAVSG